MWDLPAVKDFLPFVIVGLVTGSLYGLTGLGLVLTYKTSGVFNFAHGAIATVGAYAFYELHIQRDVPWPIAMAVSVVLVGAVLGLALERLARALAAVSPAMQVVSTVGLLIAIQGIALAQWGATARSVPAYLPDGSFDLVGVAVGYDQVIVCLVALSAAVALYVFFRSSRLGLSMQAVVDDPDLLASGGSSPVRVRATAWAIGSMFACLSGVLLVPVTGLDATILTLLVVQAFGAAAVGAFSSLPLTYAGGLAIGIVSALSTKYIGQVSWLAGFPSAVPFLTLFIVLLVIPRHRLTGGGQLKLRVRRPPDVAPLPKAAGLALALAALVAVPYVVGTRLPVYTSGLIYVAVFLSLHLLVRISGQVSLAHASFAAVGAAAFSHLASGAGVPWAIALLGAGLLTVPVGALVAIPAIRLSGLYLAIATFGFGILLERLVYPTALMFGSAGARAAPRPGIWGLSGDTGYYYTVLVVIGLMVVLTAAVVRNRLGRLLRALSDSPVALATHGTNVNLTRVLVFCISAFMAGIAGALFGVLTQSVNGDRFIYFESLEWLVVLVMAGAAAQYLPVPTALLGGVFLAILPAYLDSDMFHDYLPVLFGVSAIANALISDRPSKGREHDTVAAAPRRSPVSDRTSTPRVEAVVS